MFRFNSIVFVLFDLEIVIVFCFEKEGMLLRVILSWNGTFVDSNRSFQNCSYSVLPVSKVLRIPSAVSSDTGMPELK